ncbi:MAG TPA: molybdopterin-dependent oxidoreductase [Acidimicrobiales bacterium]|nr:molybdopterin-dependent oxidoreductase [Acidimicrobiales bacterium]
MNDGAGTPVGRRLVLGMLGLAGAGVVWGAPVQRGLERLLRPLTLNDPIGVSSFLPTAGRFRIYSVVGYLPEREPSQWRLRVSGLVDRPLELSYDALVAMPATSITRDFQCVTGWRVADVAWKGVRLREVLDTAGVAEGATALRFTSFDGAYTESLTLEQARGDDVLVAYEMLGGPVTSEHGGPVRLYVAPMYGYKSIKWLDGIELTSEVDPGYWERRGYDVDAWVGRSNGRRDEPV